MKKENSKHKSILKFALIGLILLCFPSLVKAQTGLGTAIILIYLIFVAYIWIFIIAASSLIKALKKTIEITHETKIGEETSQLTKRRRRFILVDGLLILFLGFLIYISPFVLNDEMFDPPNLMSGWIPITLAGLPLLLIFYFLHWLKFRHFVQKINFLRTPFFFSWLLVTAVFSLSLVTASQNVRICAVFLGHDRCYYGFALSSNQESLCQQITDDNMRDGCYLNAAEKKSDENLCEKVSSAFDYVYKLHCYSVVATQKNEPQICAGLANLSDVPFDASALCYLELARKNHSRQLCEEIIVAGTQEKIERLGYLKQLCFKEIQ